MSKEYNYLNELYDKENKYDISLNEYSSLITLINEDNIINDNKEISNLTNLLMNNYVKNNNFTININDKNIKLDYFTNPIIVLLYLYKFINEFNYDIEYLYKIYKKYIKIESKYNYENILLEEYKFQEKYYGEYIKIKILFEKTIFSNDFINILYGSIYKLIILLPKETKEIDIFYLYLFNVLHLLSYLYMYIITYDYNKEYIEIFHKILIETSYLTNYNSIIFLLSNYNENYIILITLYILGIISELNSNTDIENIDEFIKGFHPTNYHIRNILHYIYTKGDKNEIFNIINDIVKNILYKDNYNNIIFIHLVYQLYNLSQVNHITNETIINIRYYILNNISSFRDKLKNSGYKC